ARHSPPRSCAHSAAPAPPDLYTLSLHDALPIYRADALPKSWDPQAVESALYEGWVEKGYFKPDEDPDKEPFSIVLPPPNVTGQLHMGHALDHTLMDSIIRRKRMQGYSALWLPGYDHAGIATQTKVEARLKEVEGKSRWDYEREEFINKVWEWK